MYGLFVGEIGYDRQEFLFDLKFWEIRSIIRGYRARAHTIWEAARLTSFFIMSAMADMKKAGIHTDRDLVQFGWEDDNELIDEDQPTNEEVERLRALMREENERIEKAKKNEK